MIDLIKSLCSYDIGQRDNDEDPVARATEDANALAERLAADEELDEVTKRDVLALRKMGFGITELGERRLKGLEAPEFLSLIYPTQLAGRLKHNPDAVDELGLTLGQNGNNTLLDRPAETYEPIPHLLDVYQIQQVGMLCLRLEAATATIFKPPPPLPASTSPLSTPSRSPHLGLRPPVNRKRSIHPFLLSYPIRLDATDDELAVILEGLVYRVENVLSTLVIHQLGPYTEVLSALSEATRIDPKSIYQALSIFAGVMGQGHPGKSLSAVV